MLRPGRLLDPRPAAEASRAPVRDAVNIPLDELNARSYELPPRDAIVHVAAEGELAWKTSEVLAGMGRRGLVTEFEFGAPTEPGTLRLWQPTPFLESTIPRLRRGRVLDIGCGAGRDAVFLTAAGWDVTAVDALEDALARGRALEGRYAGGAAAIRWLCADVESPVGLAAVRESAAPAYELVTLFRYVHRGLLPALADLLAPGGQLFIETFTPQHRARFGRPARAADVITAAEAVELLAGLNVLQADEGWRSSEHTVRVWAERL